MPGAHTAMMIVMTTSDNTEKKLKIDKDDNSRIKHIGNMTNTATTAVTYLRSVNHAAASFGEMNCSVTAGIVSPMITIYAICPPNANRNMEDNAK